MKEKFLSKLFFQHSQQCESGSIFKPYFRFFEIHQYYNNETHNTTVNSRF